MGKNVPDLANRNDIAAGSRRKVQDCLAGWSNGVVPPIMRPHISGLPTAKRPCDHAADIERLKQFTRDLAHRIEALEPEFLLMCGDLKHTVGRGVADRLS